MPRHSYQPQRNSSGPQNDLIEKEAQADSLNNSMPDLLSMGNAAMQDVLFSDGPVEIPLWNGKESMSLVIGSDQENDSDDGYDSDSSEIDTSKAAKQRELERMEKRAQMRMQMSKQKVKLIDPEGHEAEGQTDRS